MKEARWGKARFPKGYQKVVGFKNGCLFLHKNSKEFVKILKDIDIIERENDKYKIFEIGAGSGRNLHYIKEEFPNVKIACNDLFKQASFEEMSDSIKDIVDFYEADTLELFEQNRFEDIDLLISSDHLMHLQTNKVIKIVLLINHKWKPKYILLRECLPTYVDKLHPRLYHEAYKDFNQEYELIFDELDVNESTRYTDRTPRFFIRVFKRK